MFGELTLGCKWQAGLRQKSHLPVDHKVAVPKVIIDIMVRLCSTPPKGIVHCHALRPTRNGLHAHMEDLLPMQPSVFTDDRCDEV